MSPLDENAVIGTSQDRCPDCGTPLQLCGHRKEGRVSSDYYGSQAGELADQGEATQEFEIWLNEYTRHELPNGHDQLLAAFMAGRQSVAPHQADAERERLISGAAVAQTVINERNENRLLRGRIAILEAERQVTEEAVTREREHILAEATSLRRSFTGKAVNVVALSDLADLLREAKSG